MNLDELLEALADCGCGGQSREDEEKEIERIEREIREAEGKPLVIPIDPDDPEAIPAPDVFTRKVKKEELVPA